MRRCIVVMLLILSLTARAENQKYIEWLVSLKDQGIPVSTEDWQPLATTPPKEHLFQIVHRYALYVDQGRLRRKLFQPAWQIDEVKSQLSRQQPASTGRLYDLESQLPEYQQLKENLRRLNG